MRANPISQLQRALLRPQSAGAVATRREPPGSDVPHEALTHLDSLHHFARHLAGSSAEAEDLVQDAYARALGKESTFTPGTNLRAWLFRILRNGFIDGRRRTRTSNVVDDGGDEHAADRASNAHEPLRVDLEMEALRGVVAANIERALATLTPDARTVVLLDLEGFTENEVAEVLGCAVGTVKSRLSPAREALRERLAEYRR